VEVRGMNNLRVAERQCYRAATRFQHAFDTISSASKTHHIFEGVAMNNRSRKIMLAVAGLMLTLALTFAGAHAQTAAPALTAGQDPRFKNIQVLKDLPADQLLPAMQFISGALGVECEACHVQGAREKDDKPMKLTARHMMQMQMDINKNNFNGNRQVTCFTCHRGSESPVSNLPVQETDTPSAPRTPPGAASAATPAALPTADQILDKYLQALGGADAVQKITTRVEKGNTINGENKTPIDIFAKAPNKRVSVSHGQNGDSITAYDGKAGWQGGGRGGPRDMAPIDSMSAMVDAVVQFPAELKKVFPQMRVRTDKIGDKEYYVISGRGPGTPAQTRFYFDEQTGLLSRVIRYNDAGLGLTPVQIDYADYRDTDGIKIPFRWTLSRPTGRFSIQIDSVQQNVPVDDSKFVKPAAPAPAQ
jgi:photosynthetic reaction center cytochrome c subunit